MKDWERIALGEEPPPEQPSAILDEIRCYVRKFVVVGDAELTVLALWVAHTYAFAAADYTPYIHVTSPTKRCGKSRLLDTLERVVHRPFVASNASDAAIYRSLVTDEGRVWVTLLWDEIDQVFAKTGDRPELVGILNAGFQRGRPAVRMVGEGAKLAPQHFDVFAPKLLAGIGRTLPDTVADRSIRVQLERKSADTHVHRARGRDLETAAFPIRRRIEGWVTAGLVTRLAEADPDLPAVLDDRACDIWAPLLAIADEAGGDWPTKARSAALALSSAIERDEPDQGIVALRIVRDLLANRRAVSTEEILRAMAADEEAPFSSLWDPVGGRPTRGAPQRLSKLLKRFGGKSRDVRFADGSKKGYRFEDLADSFDRYLPAPDPRTRDIRDSRDTTDDPHALRAHEQPVVADVADVADSEEYRLASDAVRVLACRFVDEYGGDSVVLIGGDGRDVTRTCDQLLGWLAVRPPIAEIRKILSMLQSGARRYGIPLDEEPAP